MSARGRGRRTDGLTGRISLVNEVQATIVGKDVMAALWV